MHSVMGAGHRLAGRYRLLDQIGRGAMGIVWRGRDELLDREVAVKQIILPPLASEAEAEVSYQRTLREARTAARLSHPGVVTVFDVVDEGGSPWIVMELVRARPLDQVIAEDGPLPPVQAATLGQELLAALAAAHAAGVLHRDVKPSNVLIRPEGAAVLTDFGIATIEGDPGLTQQGMVVGTPGFASPERVRGGPASTASDLWSLGATLYAAVEGRGPFDRAGGAAAIIASIATEPAPRAPSAGPLAPVIEALLRSDPALRPDAATTDKMLVHVTGQSRVHADGAGGQDLGALAAGPADASNRAAGAGPGLANAAAAAVLGAGASTDQADAGAGAGTSRAAAAIRGGEANPEQGSAPPSLGATTATQVVMVPGTAARPGVSGGDTASGTSTGLSTGLGAAVAVAGRAVGLGASAGPTLIAAPSVADQSSAIPSYVIPDLMATPVFSELRMPKAASRSDGGTMLGQLGPTGSAGPAGSDQPFGPGSQPTQPPGGSPPSGAGAPGSGWRRRAIVPLAAIAAAAVVATVVLIMIPGSKNPNAANSLDHGGSSIGTQGSGPGTGPGSRGQRSRSRSHGGTGGSGPSANRTGQARPGPKNPSGNATGPGKPSPSGGSSGSPSPNPSTSSSPSPSPSTSPVVTIPVGDAWWTVSPGTTGTIAGFRLAAPASWVQHIVGFNCYLRPASGVTRLGVSLAAFSLGPIKEAKHLQAVAIANAKYPHYRLVSILGVTFHGHAAATWQFWWRANSSSVATDVTEILFHATTAAGTQSYALYISAPANRAGWASGLMRVAMRTFKVVA